MSSFCRITGKAREMPKPNFFPIIPPISPADARKLCKITARRMDDHNFVPLIEFGKRPACIKCKITGAGVTGGKAGGDDVDDSALKLHITRDDYKYVTPILKKEAIDKEYIKSFEDLQKVLKRLKKGLGPDDENKHYVYLLPSVLCGIIVPPEVEEAIRIGELESVSISKSCSKAIFKIKGRPTMFVPLKEADMSTSENKNLFNGRGQNKETLNKQKKVLNDKKKKMFASKKIFEDLEKAADEEMMSDLERPRGKAKIFGGISKEAKQYRQKIIDFIEMYTPEGNMAVYGKWDKSLKVNVSQFDWEKISSVKPVELECPVPKKAKLSAPDDNQLSETKRIKNIYDPGMPGLEVVPAVEEVNVSELNIPQQLHDLIKTSRLEKSNSSSSLKTIFSDEYSIRILPTFPEYLKAVKKMESTIFSYSNVKFGYMYDDGDMIKYAANASEVPARSKVISGVIIKLDEQTIFIPGENINIEDEEVFVPGQRMSSVNGEFIPGASIRTQENEFQFLPGIKGEKEVDFVLGQFIESDGVVNFVKGQVVHTGRGAMFVEGQTVKTADGMKFVAGLTINTEIGPNFISGTLIDAGEESKFVPGQMVEVPKKGLVFIPGLMGEIMEKQVFVPGQTVTQADGQKAFLQGQMVNTQDGPMFLNGDVIVNNKNQVQFLPGQVTINPQNDKEEFIPGIIGEMAGGHEFIEGKFIKKGEETLFIPGKTVVFIDGVSNRFDKINDEKNIALQSMPQSPMLIDSHNLSMIFKKYRPSPGVLVKTKDGEKFYPEGKVPDDLEGAEIVPGRMEYTENGPKFVPGKVMEINGVKTFIPGRIMLDEDGLEVFIPGKTIETKNGPKFIAGQVVETADGEQFIPGQVMDSPEGPKFVPGQVIETKCGPKFIPGQVLVTDNGLKFVPGQIVETEHGAVFVPGQVIDSPDGCKFVPGQVIDTPEGPRLLPPDIEGDGEFVVQGFDINQEMQSLMGSNKELMDVSDILSGAGGSCIGGEALKALASGFKPYKSKEVVKIFGEAEEEKDVDKIMEDELLDCYDSPPVRQIIKSVFIATFAEICENVDEVIKLMDDYINGNLSNNIHKTVMSRMKLNPAIEDLKKYFQENNPNDPKEYDIMNLISGIISCSIPGALKECAENAEDVEERKLKVTLLACIEDSIRSILQEEGMVPKGLIDDIKELIQLAKELEFVENQSFFAKVAAVSEGRCNSKFMNTLLKNFTEKAHMPNFGFDMGELLNRLIQILAPRLHLQRAFHIISMNRPDVIKDVLNTLKGDVRDIEGFTAIDILHHAIAKVMNNYCNDEINGILDMMEIDPSCIDKNTGLMAMIQQAAGLASYINQPQTAQMLNELLRDPKNLTMIKSDPVALDVLKKLLCMKKLAERDAEKGQKIANLSRFGSSDRNDVLLQELYDQSNALTRPPKDKDKLKKSRSMVKKSRSIVMSAKDIPMNAFLAMKSNADRKDESWLQNFLSESVVDEVPWECSKALIILKEGFQTIIPREASRSILLGEASYTLIDDNGIQFFLSPMDKRKRRMEGKSEESPPPQPQNKRQEKRPQREDVIFEEDEEEEMEDRREYDISKVNREPVRKEDLKMPGLDEFDRPHNYVPKKIVTNGDFDDDFDPDMNSYLPPGRKPAKYQSEAAENLESEMDHLDRYRPHNFDFNTERAARGDDIQDLVDFYSNYRTKRSALGRVYGGDRMSDDMDFQPPQRRERMCDDVDGYQAQPRHAGIQISPDRQHSQEPGDDGYLPPRQKVSEPSYTSRYQQPESSAHAPGKYHDLDTIDPATRLILERAREGNTRTSSNGMFARDNRGARRSQYSPGEDFDDFAGLRPSKDPVRHEDDAMNPTTRSLLDKVRESTKALQGLADETDDYFDDQKIRGKQRKSSRFLKRSQDAGEEEGERSKYYGDLANSVLGLRNDSMGEYDKYRPEPPPVTASRSSRRFYDDNIDDEPVVTAPRSRVVDDDDTDDFIRSLKQKTSRKPMSEILNDMERKHDVTPPKFEPIAKFKDTFKPSPSPEKKYHSLGRRRGTSASRRSVGADQQPDWRSDHQRPDHQSDFGPFGSSSSGGTTGRRRGGGDDLSGGGYGSGLDYGADLQGGVGSYGSLGRKKSSYNQQYAQASFGSGASNLGASQGGYGQQQYDNYGGGGQQGYMQPPGGHSMYGGQQYGGGAQPGYPPMQGYQTDYGQGGYGGGYGGQASMGGYGAAQQPAGPAYGQFDPRYSMDPRQQRLMYSRGFGQ